MSRIGLKPVTFPSGVEVQQAGSNTLKIKGPKGNLEQAFHPDMTITIDDGKINVARPTDTSDHRALHGLTRSLISNMVHGVTEGYTKGLEIHGVGYNAAAQGAKLVLQIGFCHPVEMPVPKGLEIETPTKTKILVKGADKQAVGQFAAQIRDIRPPEPYNAKGIRYEGEYIRRKQGKAFGGAKG